MDCWRCLETGVRYLKDQFGIKYIECGKWDSGEMEYGCINKEGNLVCKNMCEAKGKKATNRNYRTVRTIRESPPNIDYKVNFLS